MTATVASLVGAGIALGFGLFATRSRWMPYAGDLNDRMQDRWDEFAHRNDDNADEGTDYNSDYRAKTDNWPKDQGTAAEYPDASKVTL